MRDCTTILFVALSLPFCALAQAPAAAMPETFESQFHRFNSMSPDEVFARLRQHVTALLSTVPGFDPGNRLVDLVVERPWPTLVGRCPVRVPLGQQFALQLVDVMIREGHIRQASAVDRDTLAAMVAALDGRICRCAHQPSLDLAAECASQK
jgi:hypothetical protein